MDHKFLTELVDAYGNALRAERTLMHEMLQASAAVDSEKVRVITEGYAVGTIDIKNAETRKAGENAAIELSPALPFLQEYEAKARYSLEQIEIDRKCIEAEISLTKAWLYSQSGVK